VTLPVQVEAGRAHLGDGDRPGRQHLRVLAEDPLFDGAAIGSSRAGGTPLTINGTDILDGAAVTIGGVAATNVNVLSFTTVHADAPRSLPAPSTTSSCTNTDGAPGPSRRATSPTSST
jgi:hypothetical protein